MLTLLVFARLTVRAATRWGGTKGITFLGRPYTKPRIKVVPPTFIKLLYTMTPFPTITFKTQIHFPNFFFRPKTHVSKVNMTASSLPLVDYKLKRTPGYERHTTNEQNLRDTARE